MNLLRFVGIALVGLVVTAPVHAQAVLPPPTAGGVGVAVPPPIETAPPGYVAPGYEALAAPASPIAATTPTTPAPGAGELDSLLPPMVEGLPAGSPLEDPLPVDTMSATITPTPHWYHPNYWWGEDPWTAGIELGINGSEGNNNTFSMRAGGHAKRETDRWKIDSSLVYNKNISNGVETQNNGKIDVRADRTLAESRWTLFMLDNLIYDEFQAWDTQLSLNGGVGYKLLDTETIDLLSRFGAGATREFGGVDNDWQPTALLGLDYEHQISKMQRATAKVDYYPEWEDFRQYRVVTDLGWQIDLDRPKNMSVKLSVIDRYDSTPDGAVPNNLDYAVLLIWGL
jgi:putative salt-induced outer membrane protein YdiY